MKNFFLALLLMTSASLFAQQYNAPNAQKREVESFHGIEVSTGIELVLTAGNTEEVAVSAASIEYRDKIITKVQNGILKIYYDNKLGAVNKRKESKHLKAWVSYKTLDVLNANTGAEVKFNGVIKGNTITSDVNTGARIEGEVNLAELKINQSTGSKVNLTGKVTKLTVEGNTGSKFIAEEMTTNDCSVRVSTGAQASVNAENALEIKASTGGVVKYKGSATIREIKTNTGGTVNKINSSK